MLKLSETRSGKKSCQLDYELNLFINFLVDKKVKNYLEIGARYGDTFYKIMKSLEVGAFGVCVDLPNSLWGAENSFKYLSEACQELTNEGYRIILINGDSTSLKVIEEIRSFAFYDACLIDGDHTYNGIKTDFKNYSPLAKYIALHDIVGYGQRHAKNINVEVPRFWSEIKNKKSIEFIQKDSKMGIGVYAK